MVIGGGCRVSVQTNGTGGPLFQVDAPGSVASGCALVVNGVQVVSADFDPNGTISPLLLSATGPAEIMFRAQLVLNQDVTYSSTPIIQIGTSATDTIVYADVDVSITAPANTATGGTAITAYDNRFGRISMTCPGRTPNIVSTGTVHLKTFPST